MMAIPRSETRLAGRRRDHRRACCPALEFMDNATINYVEDYVNIGLPRDAAAILLVSGRAPGRSPTKP
ncbi:MAG: hypothetical protein ACLR7Z_05480 [Bilophila wadsworthia]